MVLGSTSTSAPSTALNTPLAVLKCLIMFRTLTYKPVGPFVGSATIPSYVACSLSLISSSDTSFSNSKLLGPAGCCCECNPLPFATPLEEPLLLAVLPEVLETSPPARSSSTVFARHTTSRDAETARSLTDASLACKCVGATGIWHGSQRRLDATTRCDDKADADGRRPILAPGASIITMSRQVLVESLSLLLLLARARSRVTRASLSSLYYIYISME
mmetsp:Transcript_13941/g.30128  ORF Transcript_13941/g.30128 Transcript_13941/m.30128 type:complete len:218 (-) Transcript_13941:17-670(-)